MVRVVYAHALSYEHPSSLEHFGYNFFVTSNSDALNLIESDFIGRPIVELGCARALMRGDRLGVFERSTVE